MCLYSSFKSDWNHCTDGSQIVSTASIVLRFVVATSWAAGLGEVSSRCFATHLKGFFSSCWLVGSMGYLNFWGWHKRLTRVRRLTECCTFSHWTRLFSNIPNPDCSPIPQPVSFCWVLVAWTQQFLKKQRVLGNECLSSPVLVFREQLGSHFFNKLCSRQPFQANLPSCQSMVSPSSY